MTNANSMPRPAIYARVSTEEQAQSGTSLETQIQTLSEDLKSEGKPEPLVFVDDGYSGATPHRPHLMALENAIAEGKVSEVRVASLDRLSRDLVLQETLLSRWARADVPFSSRREPDLSQADATRVLIRQVLGAISQYERAVIAARMMAGKIARARQGFFAGGKVPYGYRAEGDPAKLVIDPEGAQIIREAGQRVIAGETSSAVAHDLVRRGVPGPAGNGWEPGYLARMLRNTTYAGETKFRMREAVEPLTRRSSEHAARGTKSSLRVRPEDDWITIECPDIFTPAEWEALQAALAHRSYQKNQNGTYLLSRRFRSRCGSTYVGNYNAGKIRYLCMRRTKRGITGENDCGCPQIFAETIDEAVWRTVSDVLTDPSRLATLAREELRRRGIAHSETKLKKELEVTDRKLTRAREALARLVRHHAEKATLDDATFETAAVPMREHVQALEREREKLLRVLPGAGLHEDQRAIQATAEEVIHRLETLSFAEKSRLLALLDVEVHVDENGLVKASLRAPRPAPEDQRKVCFSTYSRSRRRTSR